MLPSTMFELRGHQKEEIVGCTNLASSKPPEVHYPRMGQMYQASAHKRPVQLVADSIFCWIVLWVLSWWYGTIFAAGLRKHSFLPKTFGLCRKIPRSQCKPRFESCDDQTLLSAPKPTADWDTSFLKDPIESCHIAPLRFSWIICLFPVDIGDYLLQDTLYHIRTTLESRIRCFLCPSCEALSYSALGKSRFGGFIHPL
jgi:hypothetical protein